jgi:hypothetical protein
MEANMSELSSTQITLNEAMAAAVAAQRINKKYVRKHDADLSNPEMPIKSNGQLMRMLLETGMADNNRICTEDREEAARIIQYLEFKMVDLIAETLVDYWRECVLLTGKQVYDMNDYRSLAFIASIPNSYWNAVNRDLVQDRILEASEKSSHFGTVGEKTDLNIAILGNVYSKMYNKWYHTALTHTNNLVSFPMAEQLDESCLYTINGKIQKHVERNITRLHYVRVLNHKKIVDNTDTM